MIRRPMAPGGAVVGTVDVTGRRSSRRFSSWVIVLSVLSAAACAESDLVIVQVNDEVTALTIMVDYLVVNQSVGPAEDLVLEVGDSVSLSITALNALGLVVGHVPVIWSSSDSGVVKITDEGLVTAVAPGQAEILASADEVGARLAMAVTGTDVASAPAGQQLLENWLPVVGTIPGTGHLERIVLNEDGEELSREWLLAEFKQRIRDVRQGPDGLL